jgi:hypothetical protein
MKLVRALSRRLTYANVVASLALFAALGGSAYAANQINGGSIKKESIGGGKLKKETITSKQIKKGSLNSSVINTSTLATVPSATTATTAQTATSATTAALATRATSAETADRATSAQVAESAKTAQTADSATTAQTATTAATATSATTAASATSATEADHAKTAGDAETVGGKSAANLTVACPPATELFGGMCWDDNERGPVFWSNASSICANAGGRLPSLSELIAYVSQNDVQVTGQSWSGDVADIEGEEPEVLTSDESKRESHKAEQSAFGFRCLFYRVN